MNRSLSIHPLSFLIVPCCFFSCTHILEVETGFCCFWVKNSGAEFVHSCHKLAHSHLMSFDMSLNGSDDYFAAETILKDNVASSFLRYFIRD